MPSLRRVVSSPSLRPAPYSIQQGLQSSSARTQPARPSKKRSSTLVGGRVVLAEIEWWKVMRGQEPEADGDESGTEQDGDGGNEDGDSAPVAPSPEDELIANAVRLAISTESHEPDSPPPVFADESGGEEALTATPSEVDTYPLLSVAVHASLTTCTRSPRALFRALIPLRHLRALRL